MINLFKTLKNKLDSFNEPLTAEKAWARTNFNQNSKDKVISKEKESIQREIKYAISIGINYVFYPLNNLLTYTSIEEDLKQKGFHIVKGQEPIAYWIISW